MACVSAANALLACSSIDMLLAPILAQVGLELGLQNSFYIVHVYGILQKQNKD